MQQRQALSSTIKAEIKYEHPSIVYRGLHDILHSVQSVNHLDDNSKLEQDYIHSQFKLKNYYIQLLQELTKFIGAYMHLSTGLIKNSNDLISGAIENSTDIFCKIPIAGTLFEIFKERIISYYHDNYRMAEMNRVIYLFRNSDEMQFVCTKYARQLTIAKEDEILRQDDDEYNVAWHSEFIDKARKLIKEYALRGMHRISNIAGQTLQPEEKLALLDAAYLLDKIMSGNVIIDRNNDIGEQFLKIMKGASYRYTLPSTVSLHGKNTLSTKQIIKGLESNHKRFEFRINNTQENVATLNQVLLEGKSIEQLPNVLLENRRNVAEHESRLQRLENQLSCMKEDISTLQNTNEELTSKLATQTRKTQEAEKKIESLKTEQEFNLFSNNASTLFATGFDLTSNEDKNQLVRELHAFVKLRTSEKNSNKNSLYMNHIAGDEINAANKLTYVLQGLEEPDFETRDIAALLDGRLGNIVKQYPFALDLIKSPYEDSAVRGLADKEKINLQSFTFGATLSHYRSRNAVVR